MRLIGAYFDLTDAHNPAAGSRRDDAPGDGAGESAGESGERNDRVMDRVLISVAKRLVPSAVRRNTVKRVVREAWRAAIRKAEPTGRISHESTQPTTTSGSAHHTGRVEQQTGSAGDGAKPVRSCLVRLKRYPGVPVKTRSAASSGSTVAATAKPGLAMIKRSLRADIDKLFAAFLVRRPLGRSTPHRPSATAVPRSPAVSKSR